MFAATRANGAVRISLGLGIIEKVDGVRMLAHEESIDVEGYSWSLLPVT